MLDSTLYNIYPTTFLTVYKNGWLCQQEHKELPQHVCKPSKVVGDGVHIGSVL